MKDQANNVWLAEIFCQLDTRTCPGKASNIHWILAYNPQNCLNKLRTRTVQILHVGDLIARVTYSTLWITVFAGTALGQTATVCNAIDEELFCYKLNYLRVSNYLPYFTWFVRAPGAAAHQDKRPSHLSLCRTTCSHDMLFLSVPRFHIWNSYRTLDHCRL